MPKTITSPVARFPGTVTLSDPLTFPQSFAFEDALNAARELGDNPSLSRANYAILPGVLACVEAWRLEGIPEYPTLEAFPSTPRKPIADLVAWLVNEIGALYREADNVPLP